MVIARKGPFSGKFVETTTLCISEREVIKLTETGRRTVVRVTMCMYVNYII